MNDCPRCPDRDTVAATAATATATAKPAATAAILARYKQASLGQQAQRAAWDLGALVRRVEHEAPAAHRTLLAAVKVLQQLALQHSGDIARPHPEAVVADLPPGGPRQGELF